MPKFSIVIPTRARADTLQHSLRTALAQTYSDLEVIVQESGDDADTAAVLAGARDLRLRAYKTGDPVRMTENWERALARAEGEYIFFMGDDDGLLPDACTIASRFFDESPDIDILSWRPASYLWPRFPVPGMRDRIHAVCSSRLVYTIKDTKERLALIYRFRENFSLLPMIYNNSMISRRLIDRVRAERGRYFFGSSPDVISGIVNSRYADRFALSNRPLSIIGASHNSTGFQSGRSDDAETRRKATEAAFGNFVTHSKMVESRHLPFVNGNEFLVAKDELFPDGPPDVDFAGMLEEAGATINELPGRYEATLDECRLIAAKNGVTFNDSHVPPPGPPPLPPPPLGRHEVAPGVIALDINGRAHGVENVFDATRFLHQSMPACDGTEFDIDVEPAAISQIDLAAQRQVALDFGTQGNGVRLLGLGWSYLDASGVWAVGSRADVTLPMRRDVHGRCHIKLEGHVFHPPRSFKFTAKFGEHTCTREIRIDRPALQLELGPITIDTTGALRALHLIVEMDRAPSPAEAGVNGDIRRVGLFLQRIQVSAEESRTVTLA